MFLLVLQVWWTGFSVLQEEAFGRALVFLPYLLVILGLYLACTFALPDPDAAKSLFSPGPARSTDALDLEAFYFSVAHRRWFFGTIIGIILLFEAIMISFFLVESDIPLLTVVARR